MIDSPFYLRGTFNNKQSVKREHVSLWAPQSDQRFADQRFVSVQMQFYYIFSSK